MSARTRWFTATALLGSALLTTAPAGLPAEPTPRPVDVKSPVSPDEARRLFRVAPGLTVELVAAEPDVQSPVDAAFDEDGRLWVVEMGDYPNGPATGQPPQGRIRILEDRDGSGRYRHSSVFADRLLFANGVLPWRGGAIVTAAPHILLLNDSRRTGVADRREVLFEGFAAQNPQLRVSHPVLGVDNFVYVANGLRGGQVKRSGTDHPPVSLSGMDFRFDTDFRRYEPVTGMGQFGNTIDDWGRRFVCTNRNHLVPIGLPNHYVKRNPYLAVPEPRRDDQGPGGAARIFPLSKNFTTSTLHVGTFSASCGVTVYRGSLLPAGFRGGVFTCDPTGNLVHQEVLTPDGATFTWKPPREGVEFLATPDDWCRPVNLFHGPDGALYVVDMYRAVIEHPEFMPAELKARPDLLLGKDRGRIWRVVPESPRPRPVKPRLSQASAGELVALLATPDGWWRTTAQRLLLERADPAAIPPLRETLRSGPPLAKLHAAYLLDSFRALDRQAVKGLLRADESRLVEHAVRLAEPWLAGDAEAQDMIVRLAGHPDARLRYQVALSLGEWDDDRILAPLARVVLAGADDHWTRTAVASSVPRRAGALLTRVCREANGSGADSTPGRRAVVQELAAVVGARQDPDEVADVLAALGGLPGPDAVRWQTAGLRGLADGMGHRGTQLAAFLRTLPAPRRAAADQASRLLAAAAGVAGDRTRETSERVAAVGLLAHARWETAGPPLTALVTADPAQDIRLAAVRALAAHPGDEVVTILIGSWPGQTPALRREITEALVRQPDRAVALLKAVEAGRVRATDIDPQRSRQLVNHPRPDVREPAAKLLKGNLPGNRKLVLEQYRAALKLKGDLDRGRAVFRKHCATCHRVENFGHEVGPDISDLRTKLPEMLLLDVIDPNAAIDSNFVNYAVTTKSGKLLTGLIAGESASGIILKRAEGQTEVVLRQDVEEINSTGVSLMPEGLEKAVSVEQMADLLVYLKTWRYVASGVPVGETPGR